jgi:hypothetical protein
MFMFMLLVPPDLVQDALLPTPDGLLADVPAPGSVAILTAMGTVVVPDVERFESAPALFALATRQLLLTPH